ncbi:hypothetical protein Pmani_018681 [Petrolisthes manimaculis]|uniref:Uncharacterized protein n=1 Tax=Petrolisthes manimaculis TaxID=1843537 RepID=A0AAE1PKI0_9EUCA|nr:hypothetical protein Pmani_018681 [Petrolisthes manimaculis]
MRNGFSRRKSGVQRCGPCGDKCIQAKYRYGVRRGVPGHHRSHSQDCLALTHAQEGQVRPRPAPTETGELQDEQPLPLPVPSLTSDRSTTRVTRQSPQVQTQTRQQQQQTIQRPDQLHRESEGTHWTPGTPRSEDPRRRGRSNNEEEQEYEVSFLQSFEGEHYDPYYGTRQVSVERRVLLWMIVAFLIIVTIFALVLLALLFRLKMAIECLVQKICCNKTLCCN